MKTIRHYEVPEGLDADEDILFIKTSPADLDETKHETSGMGVLLMYAVGVVSILAAIVIAVK
jgi:hypothetical protein